jgi:hypothetical protein
MCGPCIWAAKFFRAHLSFSAVRPNFFSEFLEFLTKVVTKFSCQVTDFATHKTQKPNT